jgi:hypothetical protein
MLPPDARVIDMALYRQRRIARAQTADEEIADRDRADELRRMADAWLRGQLEPHYLPNPSVQRADNERTTKGEQRYGPTS